MKLTIPSFFRRKKNTCEKCHWIFIGNGYAFGAIKAAFFECKECKTIYWETRWMKPKYNHLLTKAPTP